jgi:hypothetical protein
VTKVARPTGTKMGIREQGTAEQRTRGRARPPSPMAVTDRTQQQEQTRPSWPGRAHGLVKLLSPRCSRHAAVRPPLARATSSAAGSGTATPRPGPPRPRWGSKGPDLGRKDAATIVSLRHPATKQRRRRHLATPSRAPARRRRCWNVVDLGAPSSAEGSPAPPYQSCGYRQGRRRRHRGAFARRPAPTAAVGKEEGGARRLGFPSPRRRPRGWCGTVFSIFTVSST